MSMFKYKSDSTRSYGAMVGWCKTSDDMLVAAEDMLLSHIKSLRGAGVMVDIGPVISPDGDTVLTYIADNRHKNYQMIGDDSHTPNKFSSNTVINRQTRSQSSFSNNKQTKDKMVSQCDRDSDTDATSNHPLVLLHGFGCASALWCLNVDALARYRTVYFMDILGFGRSSRPVFSTDPTIAEDELLESVEAWRKVVGLERFILLGHSFGAYLATSYAIKYPNRIIHLILEDPWGFPRQVGRYNKLSGGVILMWVLSHFVPPLFLLRWLGPYGHWYLHSLMPPFETKMFEAAVENPRDVVYDYFYHCNARNPTGEVAFHTLMRGVAWARRPMVERVHLLREDVPITFIHGQNSWVSKKTSYKVRELRPNSYVDIKIVTGASHVIHSDTPEAFNSLVNNLLDDIDRGIIPSTKCTSLPVRMQIVSTGTVNLPTRQQLATQHA